MNNDIKKINSNESSVAPYTMDIIDIDKIIYNYVKDAINVKVQNDDGSSVIVETMFSTPDRTANIKKFISLKPESADNKITGKNQVNLPLILVTQSGIDRNRDIYNSPNVNTYNWYNYEDYEIYYKNNLYDPNKMYRNNNNKKVIKTIFIPKYFKLTYDITLLSKFIYQNNQMIGQFISHDNKYWGGESDMKFYTKINSISKTVEQNYGEYRKVQTTINVEVMAYIISKYDAENISSNIYKQQKLIVQNEK